LKDISLNCCKLVIFIVHGAGRPLLGVAIFTTQLSKQFYHIFCTVFVNKSTGTIYFFLFYVIVQTGNPQTLRSVTEHQVQSTSIWEKSLDQRKGQTTYF